MSPSIDIDEQVWDELKERAEPFVDTPNSVLRRLMGIDSAKGNDFDVPSPSRRRNGGAPNRSSRARKRAPAGSLLPESEYELPILRALAERGGRAPTREVVEAVGAFVDDKLTDLDREKLRSGEIRWQNRVQFTRLKMIEEGLLKKGSPRGTWEIDSHGEAMLSKAR